MTSGPSNDDTTPRAKDPRCMPKRIVPEHSTERDLYRHLNQVFNQRAADLLRDGRNPEQAAMLAAEYSQRAQALDPQATKR